jgi:F1F0 ATPase subunit 2
MDRMAMDAPIMIETVVLALVSGAVLGAAHLGALWWSVVLLRDGRALAGFGVQALRFVPLALTLAFFARQGVAPLLAASLGVLVARELLMRRLRRSA